MRRVQDNAIRAALEHLHDADNSEDQATIM
jgi:hypothetical protein